MKVAIVTPYYREDPAVLRRCHDSVRSQTHGGVTHIMVADGYPDFAVSDWDCEHMIMPACHHDAGATPRALGALSAFGRGFDAVGFLDADNWFDPNHVETMVGVVLGEQAQFVAGTRRIHCGISGQALYTDTVESTAGELLDTNCMFLTRELAGVLSAWIVGPEDILISDRIFWKAVKSSGATIARHMVPTVAYSTRWAFHYGYAGVDIPDQAVWMRFAADGSVRHDHGSYIRHGDLTEEQKRDALARAINGLGG